MTNLVFDCLTINDISLYSEFDVTIKFAGKTYQGKIIPYSKESIYGNPDNNSHPINVNIELHRLLSKITNHVINPNIIMINTKYLISHIEKLIDNKPNIKHLDQYDEFLEMYKQDQYYEECPILCLIEDNSIDLFNYISNNSQIFSKSDWKLIFYQILLTLAEIQMVYPKFQHNCLHLCKSWFINSKNEITLRNFRFAYIEGIMNNHYYLNNFNHKIIFNRYVDMHFVFNQLKTLFMDKILDIDTKNFLHRIIPEKYSGENTINTSEIGRLLTTNKFGRLQIDDEYMIPKDILDNDPYFEEYKIIF